MSTSEPATCAAMRALPSLRLRIGEASEFALSDEASAERELSNAGASPKRIPAQRAPGQSSRPDLYDGGFAQLRAGIVRGAQTISHRGPFVLARARIDPAAERAMPLPAEGLQFHAEKA